MRALYVDEKLLNIQYIENMEKAKILRESADYSGEYSEEAAKELIENSRKFLERAKEIIKNHNEL